MRAGTEIDEHIPILDRVAGHVALALRLFIDQLYLQRLAAAAEKSFRLLARPHLAFVRKILLRKLAHLLLDRLEIFGYERARHDEVVKEAFVRRGPDAALHPLKKVRDGRRQQVRGAVAVQAQRLGALGRHHPDLGIALERKRQIHQAVVDHCG